MQPRLTRTVNEPLIRRFLAHAHHSQNGMSLLDDALSDELLVHCLGYVDRAVELASASAVSPRWRLAARLAAEQQLGPPPPHAHGGDFNLFLQLSTIECLASVLGPRPQSRTWREEYADIMVDEMRELHHLGRFPDQIWDEAEDVLFFHEMFSAPEYLVNRVRKDRDIEYGIGSGMPLALSEAFAVLGCDCPLVLFANGRKHLAAASYACCDALSCMARLDVNAAIAPTAYIGLDGAYGLAERDGVWNHLLAMDDAAVVGQRFRTARMHTFITACQAHFPDGVTDGIYCDWGDLDVPEGEDDLRVPGTNSCLWSHNVVCIRSARNDAGGRHSLIREACTPPSREEGTCYALPPYAVVTVQSVHRKWRVRRQTMACRLITCTVTFDLR